MNSLAAVFEILRQSGNRIERRIRFLTPFLTRDCRWIASSLSRCSDSCCAVHCQWWRDHLNAAICRMLRARFCLFFWGALQVIELIHATLFWRFSWRHFCRVFACDWELIHAAICRMLTVFLLRFFDAVSEEHCRWLSSLMLRFWRCLVTFICWDLCCLLCLFCACEGVQDVERLCECDAGLLPLCISVSFACHWKEDSVVVSFCCC